MKHLCHYLGLFGLELDSCSLAFHKTGLCLCFVMRAPEYFYDKVYYIAGFYKTFLDLFLFFFLPEKRRIFSAVYFILELNIVPDGITKGQCLRTAVSDCQHISTESILKPGLFIQKVLEILHIGITLKLYNYAYAFLGRLVGYINNIRSLSCLLKSRYILQEFSDAASYHGIRDLSDDNKGMSALSLLNLHLSADLDLSCACPVYLSQLILICNNAACREIRSLYILKQFFGSDLLILYISLLRFYHFCEIVGRYIGSHSDCYTFRAIHQKI